MRTTDLLITSQLIYGWSTADLRLSYFRRASACERRLREKGRRSELIWHGRSLWRIPSKG